MKAAVFKGVGTVTLDERAMPEISDEEVLVKVHAASICGTDLKIIRGGHFRVGPDETRVLGHELAGDIVAVGDHVAHWKVGQRVSVVPNIGCGHCDMCRRGLNNMCPNYDAFGINIDGGFQQYMVVNPAALYGGNLFEIPNSLDYEAAALVEPLSCCFNAWKDLSVTPEDRVLILGTGPIAALFLQLARSYGARQVIVVGRRESRLQEIAGQGATDTVNSAAVDVHDEVMRLTGGHGVDVALTCAPAPELQGLALGLLARYGRMNFFSGLTKGSKVELDTNKVHYWGLTLLGSTGSSIKDYARSMKLVESGQIDVKSVISHRFGMDEAVAGFDHALTGKGMKTLILPQEAKLR
ncbi:alcohol dehydrogenase catalytic domain-containing protein [Arenibacterium sp. LLYu02]|uniref:alcohol dehydrogenase catalytic domain-containing protein n=1 Tax=Arenibacterium sp. LLYu02 TaxID=3404132 RepID=UPI003B20E20E